MTYSTDQCDRVYLTVVCVHDIHLEPDCINHRSCDHVIQNG